VSELLSIAIPTRNRAGYLKELLHLLEEQVNFDAQILNNVKVYVFDNLSNDDTENIVKSLDVNIIYQKNQSNVGADLNIFQAYSKVEGKYVWVIGDDELLEKNALNLVFESINSYHPHLIINRCRGLGTSIESSIFPNYLEFALTCKQYLPNLLIAHSLISLNIVLRNCFDVEFALEKMDTHYAHFYGMMKGLKSDPGLVLFPQQETVIIRAQRAGWVDGIEPANIFKEHQNYLEWLTTEYHL
jgi:glycosyltransferase involved in cell wall biosynthesis